MFRKFLISTAAALSFVAPASAASIQVNFGATNAIPGNNDFQSQLNGLGFVSFATLGTSLILDQNAKITFEFLGSESGFNDTFTAGTVTHTENTNFTPWSSLNIGTTSALAGSLANFLKFTSAGGVNATVGNDGFGIFLTANQLSGQSFNVLYFGYDDQINNQDDNHDDFIIRAVVTAVPEPGTWAMLLSGFVLVGSLLRRRRNNAVPVLA